MSEHAAASGLKPSGVELAALAVDPTHTETGTSEAAASSPAAAAAANSQEQRLGAQQQAPQNGSSSSSAAKNETDLPASYVNYLAAMRAAWTDLPDLTITYSNVAYEVQVPVKEAALPSIPNSLINNLKGLNVFRDKSKETRLFRPMQPCSGVVRPGELTLVLAPPGHGKSVLLKTLAGRMHAREADAIKGEVRWNGLNAKESAAVGQQVHKMCAYVEQGDAHFPMLTVRETFQFACDNSTADVGQLSHAEFAERQAKKVDSMLELLGLKECADTIVGNAVMRGVSGGQKKRVTLGEMMIGQARALFLDEISTGLDAAATFDITSALKRWTRVMNGSAYVALLQPAPEVFNMFDRIILMREGHIVFSGSKAELEAHLKECNIKPNPDVDFADWLVEYLTDPPAVWKRDTEARGRQSSMASFRKSFREEHPDSQQVAPPPEASPSPPPVTPGVVRFHVDPASQGRDEAKSEGAPPAAGVQSNGEPRKKGLGQVVSSKGVPMSTKSLLRKYHESRVYQDMMAEISQRDQVTLERHQQQQAQAQAAAGGSKKPVAGGHLSPFTRSQYYNTQSRSAWFHTKSCLQRQATVMSRSVATLIVPGIFQAVFMGLVMGSLFYRLSDTAVAASTRVGLMLFALTFMAFQNMPEVPQATEYKLVVWKQVDAGFYPTASYVFSVILMSLPLACAVAAIYGSIIYWMTGFNEDAGNYFFFLLVLLLVNLALGAIFRCIAYGVNNADVAVNMAGPMTAIFMLFAGFLITKEKIPNWLIEFYWLSPFSWAVRSTAQNELYSGRYTDEEGAAYLQQPFQIPTDKAYKWAAVGYLAGVFVLFVFLSSFVLSSKRSWLTIGTRRNTNEEPAQAGGENGGAPAAEESKGRVVVQTVGHQTRQLQSHQSAVYEVRLGAKTTSMAADAEAHARQEEANQLDFQKMDLSFRNLRYTVTVTEQDDDGKKRTYDRALLQGVNGFAKAGELTALMGSSGAGKTTLMDVIAGRKTSGTITGDILVNGHPQQFPSFNRMMGYCEQQDIHVGTATVREAVDFSATLRLPASVSEEARRRFVDQILEDLELTPLAHRLVGDANIEGLSPGELKRLTIGVELASNPSFLFLDEPTSGLDSRAALIVVRVIRKIAQRGRAVVCTIHQPSAELFGSFDRLLLLKSGGREVYFGPIGEDGVDVARYFLEADIDPQFFRPSLPPRVNVASWMLDVIGAGTSAKGKIAPYDEVYRAHPLRSANMETVDRLCTPDPNVAPAKFDHVYASSGVKQLYVVFRRLTSMYWRDTDYNGTKFFMMIFLGILFGLVWLDIDDTDQAGMTSKISVLFMGFAFMGVLQASNAMPVCFKLREVFYRERAANTFAPWVYSTSLALIELPYIFACSLLFCLPLYFLVGFVDSGSLFFQFTFTVWLGGVCFCYMGQLLAALCPNMQVAQGLQGLVFTFFFLFGGVFIQKNQMPQGWRWMYYIDPVPKGFNSLVIQQFYCEGADCPTVTTAMGVTLTKWAYAQNFIGSGEDFKWKWIGWLVLTIAVVHIMVILCVRSINHQKR